MKVSQAISTNFFYLTWLNASVCPFHLVQPIDGSKISHTYGRENCELRVGKYEKIHLDFPISVYEALLYQVILRVLVFT